MSADVRATLASHSSSIVIARPISDGPAVKRAANSPIGAMLAIALATAPAPAEAVQPTASTLVQPDRTQLVETPVVMNDFALTNVDAQPFKFSELRDQTALVFFGFTNCPSVCPPTMQRLREVQRTLAGEKSHLKCVFISVDGERDTPAAMKGFLEPFMPGFVGLTGDPRAVRDIAAEFSAVFFKGMPTDDAGGYNVEHTSQVYLVDRNGRLRATFFNAPAGDMIDVTRGVMRQAD